jgi:hypothetical protein
MASSRVPNPPGKRTAASDSFKNATLRLKKYLYRIILESSLITELAFCSKGSWIFTPKDRSGPAPSLTAEEMKIALDELVDKSKHIEKGKMLYEVIDFHLPSLAAISIEFSRLPAILGLMKKFNRAAILTDKA